MRGKLDAVVRVVAGQTVTGRLRNALRGLDVTWEGDGALEAFTTKLDRGLFQGSINRSDVRCYRPAGLKRKDSGPRWFDPYMPPLVANYVAPRLGWRILLVGAQQIVEGSLVREITAKGTEKLLAAWDERSGQLLSEPAYYPTLESLRSSEAWIASQIFRHPNQKRVNVCEHCHRCNWELQGSFDNCVAIVTGVGSHVMQTDWLVYRSQRR